MKKLKQTCCEPFEKNIFRFRWFKIDGQDCYLMPYLQLKDDKFRVNFCPFCGADVSRMRFTEEELESLT